MLRALALILLLPAISFATKPRPELFVTSWCPACEKAEEFLKDNKIYFKKFDIEKSTAGRIKYRQTGLTGVPVFKVGDILIQGFDPAAYQQAVQEKRR